MRKMAVELDGEDNAKLRDVAKHFGLTVRRAASEVLEAASLYLSESMALVYEAGWNDRLPPLAAVSDVFSAVVDELGKKGLLKSSTR